VKRRAALGSLLGLGAAVAGGCAVDPMKSAHGPLEVLDRELATIAADPARPLRSLSALALRGGRVAYEREASTLYRVASISKLVTTLGVMRLVEERRLSLDDDIGSRNPAFPQVAVTLRMLLCHTSSMTDAAGYYTFEEGTDLREVLADPRAWSTHAPGTYFSYCNLAWGFVATLMERATGERFDRLMLRLVLEPLGMSGGYNPAELSPQALSRLVPLYRKRPAGESNDWDPAGPWIAQVDDYSAAPPVSRASDAYRPGRNGSLFGPQGGLRASAADLGRVMRMLAGGGTLDGVRVLQASSVEEMLRTQWRYDGTNGESGYGSHRGRFNAWGLGNQQFVGLSGPDYGDRLVEGGGFDAVGHLGDAYGLLATLAFDPRTGDGFVFLVGGTGFDPETDRGRWSAGASFEERIATALYRRAVQPRAG
jgi:CubicO group peptidase (beta-lactamase class C family)